MNRWMQKMLESKRAARKELAALPFARKLEILEKLRDRSLLIASSPLRQRQSSKPKAGEDSWPTK
jgi:hypothetical protein